MAVPALAAAIVLIVFAARSCYFSLVRAIPAYSACALRLRVRSEPRRSSDGPINYIAQNGIQVSYGAMASVLRNKVTGNSYDGTQPASSGGILVVGGPCFGTGLPYTVNTRIMQNTLDGNDVAVFIFQASDVNCSVVPTTQTNLKVVNNTITKGNVLNCCGWNGSIPYTAGVSDFGVNDKIVSNSITGYTANVPPSTGNAIDTTGSAKAKVQANKD